MGEQRRGARAAGLGLAASALILAAGAAALAVWLIPAITLVGRREDLPTSYLGRQNPLAHDASAIAAGAALFRDNCASCHGERGDGKGPASTGLAPAPADFRAGLVLQAHSDAYLFYRVSEGKAGTAMPSFRGVLDEHERWQVIVYLRALEGERQRPDAPTGTEDASG